MLKWLIGAARRWFLLDFAYYGNTIAAPEIVSKISPTATLIQSTLITLCIFVVFALPGYVRRDRQDRDDRPQEDPDRRLRR